MKKRILLSLVLVLLLSFIIGYVVFANVGSKTFISDTDAKVFYAGYGAFPEGWNTPGFDDSGWKDVELYQHPEYLDPEIKSPFAGSGAQWISYDSDPEEHPDYNDPSMIDGEENFAIYLFRKAFTIPDTAYNLSGTIAMAADNFGELYLNGDLSILISPNESGVNFRTDGIATGTIPVENLQCDNIIAGKVENGAISSGEEAHGPVALLFLLEFDYETPDIKWLTPITNNDFDLQNGTTLPIRFEIYTQDGSLIMDTQDVVLQVYDGDTMLVEYSLGDGADSLRIDHFEYHYIANFDTRDYEIADGTELTAVILDGCSGDELGSISFILYDEKGTDRGNQWGGK